MIQAQYWDIFNVYKLMGLLFFAFYFQISIRASLDFGKSFITRIKFSILDFSFFRNINTYVVVYNNFEKRE